MYQKYQSEIPRISFTLIPKLNLSKIFRIHLSNLDEIQKLMRENKLIYDQAPKRYEQLWTQVDSRSKCTTGS